MTASELLSECADFQTATTVAELAGHCLELVARATSCDSAIYAVTDNHRGRCAGAFWPDNCNLPDYMPAYEAHWRENPIGNRHGLLGLNNVVRLEDAIEASHLFRLNYFSEYIRPARISDVMTGYMPRRGRYRLAITAVRSGGKFTEDERDAMENIRGHAVQAFANFTELAALSGTPVTIADILNSGLHTGMVIRESAEETLTPVRRLPLTPAEMRVLSWMSQGKTNPEIAIILDCSVRTIHKHVEHILQKLYVENRVTAVVRALGMRLV